MKDFLRLIASFLIFSFVFPSVTLAVSASYQSTTTVDSLWRTNGSINAMAVGPDNTLYLAGDFTSLSRNAAGIGIFDVATGTLLYPSVNTNGTINAAIPDGSGGWYIGGSFTKVNGTTRNNVARVASTGTLVTAFDADVNSIVYALAATGTTLYVGGSFSTVNSATTRSYLAAVDKTTGTVVSGFDAGLSSSVQAIVVSGDKIVAGGNFVSTASSSVPASSIVVLNATTGAVAGTLPGLTAAVSVGSLTTDDTGTIYAGGNFSYAGFSVKNLAMINATSGLRLASSTVLSDGAISAIVPDGSGGWYVGGAFTSIGGTTIKRAARINSDGSVNTTFNPDPNSTVSAIAVSGSRVYLGGSFTSIASSSFPAPSFAAVDATTGAPVATASSTGFNSSISAITVGSEGTVYVGGGFTAVGNAAKGVAFFDITTGALTSSSTGVVFEGNGTTATIFSAAADGSGGWYVGGLFYAVNGVRRNNIAHITSSGTLDTTFDPNVNSTVRALLKSGSVIYAGGDFTTVNGGTAKPRLAAFDATTGTATGTLPNIGATVHSLELYNGILYVGGSFRTAATFDGVNDRRGVGAIDLSTGSTTAFNPCVDNNPTNIYDLEVSNDILFVGGQFSTYNNCTGQTAASKSGVVGFYLDSSTGTHVYTLATSLGTVRAITATGTTLYVGGDFTTVSGVTRNRIAAIDLTTSTGTATSFDPNVNGSVYTLKLDGTTLYAGGTFTTVNNGGATRNLIAAFDTTTATNNVTSFDTGGVNSTVQILLKDGSTLFAGGAFTIAQLATRNRMMAFSSSTLAVTDFDPNVNSTVVALVASGTTLYAGGSFTSVNTGGTVATRNRLAAFDLNTTTGTVTTFDPNLGSTVNALTLNGTTLYAGGAFTTVNNSSATRNRIAAFDTTLATGNVTTFDPNVNGTASALFLSGTTLYAGGAFTTVNNGGSTRHSLAAFDTTTATNNVVAAIVPNVTNSFSQTVNALAVVGDNLLFGGTFSVYDAVARNALAAFSSSTFALTDFNPNINSTVSALVASGTTLYVGGSFTSVNTGGTVATRNRLAAFDLNTTTGTVTSFNPNMGSTVSALAIDGSTLYAGGSFTTTAGGGTTRNRVAAIDVGTALATTFDPNLNSSVQVISIVGGVPLVGGSFSTANPITRTRLAALNQTTGVPTSWDPAANNRVYAMEMSTSSIFIAGNFTSITAATAAGGGANTRTNLAEIALSDGSVTTWDPTPTGGTYALLGPVTTSSVYVAGNFTGITASSTASSRSYIAELSRFNRGEPTAWTPPTLNAAPVVCLSSLSPKAGLYLTGSSTMYLFSGSGGFTTVGGTTRNHAAEINLSDNSLTSWDPNNASGDLCDFGVDNTSVYLGGFSLTVGGTSIGSLTSVSRSTGAITSGFTTGSYSSGIMRLLVASSTVYNAGDFTTIGSASRRVAEIQISDASATAFAPAFDFASTWTARIPSILKTSDYFYVSDSNGMLVRFASSTSASSNSAPSATIGTPAQISASSTTRFTAVVSDTNSDATSLLIQYSTDNSTWASTTLGTVTADTGTATAATGIISSIDTNSSSSVTLTIDWLSGTDIANTDDTTVYLRIKPYDGTDYAASFTTSAAFAVDTASPSAPGALTSNTIGSTTAILNLPSATSTDTNFLDYKIYYSTSSPVTTADTAFTSSTDSDLASATFNNTTTTTITGLTGNTTYYFKLFAFDSFGNSTSSAQISGTTTVPPATQPTNFSATSIGLSSIDLSWDSTGDSYMVENVTNGTTATTTATSMTLTGLSCLRTYSLRIRAYDSLGVSTSYTSPIQVTTINCGGGGGGSSSGGGGGGGSSYVAPVVPGGSNSSGFGVSQSSISLAQLQHQASILQEQLNSMGGGRDLQTGDTGPDVASIQKILVAKGLLKMPKGEGFGYFGGLTKAAVMAFQKSQGISRTGVVGPKTRAALLFGSTSTNSSVAPAPSSFKSLQQTLNKLGFVVAKTGPGSIGNETNVFGNATKEALIKFQIEYGIIKNANSQGAGVYGPKTKEKIAELVK